MSSTVIDRSQKSARNAGGAQHGGVGYLVVG
jgi:hypothetical protein